MPDPTAEEPTRRRATYCLVLLDDYSRRVVAGRFAWAADAALLEELLAAAVAQWGAPERVYCDNGQIYPSDRPTTVLAGWGPGSCTPPRTSPREKVMPSGVLCKVRPAEPRHAGVGPPDRLP